MKKLLLFLIINFSFSIINYCKGQNPLVKQWDKRFGGTDYEWFNSIQQTIDGGFILGGYSFSRISGDKTQDNWDTTTQTADYWVVKIDSIGIKQWDKVFGGEDDDRLTIVQQTKDGGYIFGGYSLSPISGDKTQGSQDTSLLINQRGDYWIVKTDMLGNKQWDKRFGGANCEELYSLQQTADGGYILGGYSFSDSSGDKTQNIWGGNGDWDYWIVKTDSLGNKQWDKDFGGTSSDELYSVQQTSDNGFILGGRSYSGIGGNKTQPGWGSFDYWIVKTDSIGNKQWDRDYGGTGYDYLYSILQTVDDGYILGGLSASGISGDKTQATWGNTDYWMIKTDSIGNKQWDKDFGGTYIDEGYNIIKTNDNGFLISGDSYSSMGGNKTENNLGTEQAWMVKTDSLGNLQWDKTIFTSGHDESGLAIQTKDGCYVIQARTLAGMGGYKTQSSWGSSDYWIVKFCDSTLSTNVTALYEGEKFAVYPNPFTSEISFTIQQQNITQVSFIIKNVLGQTVFTKQENNLNSIYTKTVDLSFLSKGIYFLDIIIDGNRTVRKIVKE